MWPVVAAERLRQAIRAWADNPARLTWQNPNPVDYGALTPLIDKLSAQLPQEGPTALAPTRWLALRAGLPSTSTRPASIRARASVREQCPSFDSARGKLTVDAAWEGGRTRRVTERMAPCLKS